MAKGVDFFYVYKTLAHPDWNNYIAPYTLEERLMHVAEAKRTLGSQIPWLCDAMDSRFTKAMGGAPNSEFIIGPDGTIVSRHGWSNAERLRSELAELVGAVENPTKMEDLNMPVPKPLAAAETGIVPRIERPEFMMTVQSEPKKGEDGEPFYTKLRAEVTRDVLQTGSGMVYLGFLLDPLYHVHWNNLVAPIQVTITADDGVTISPETLTGPEVDAEGDADPREFLVNVSNWEEGKTITVSAFYFACSDEEGWCKPVKQEYVLSLKQARGSGFTFRPEYRQRMLDSLDWRDNGGGEQTITASAEQIDALVGTWSMDTKFGAYTLHLSFEDGKMTGWDTMDRADPDVTVLSFDGIELRFLHLAGPSPEEVVLKLEDGKLSGFQYSPFGDSETTGTKNESDS